MLKTKVVSMVTRYPPQKFQTPHVSLYAVPKNAFFIWEPPEGPYMKPYSYSILHITPYLSYSIVYTAGWEGC